MKYFIIFLILFLIVFIIIIIIVRRILPKVVIKELEQYENTLVSRHSDEIRNIYREMRGWRHDYRNHMQVLKAYIDSKQWEECENYIKQMDIDLTSVDHIIKTGNIMADAIVNSKVSSAKEKMINIDITTKIPQDLPITDLEFCVLFGNLMDNAMEACARMADIKERFIRVYLGIFKQQFYMSISNSTDTDKRISEYRTGKGDGHGLGLYRIDNIVHQHNGYLNRKNEPGVFVTEIMIPFKTEM